MALFGSTKCIGGKITRPLHAVGDANHKIYELDCIIDSDDYAPIALDTAFSNATAAGVDQLPSGVGPDSAAYFVGDSEPRDFDGPLVRFTRRFATIPSTRYRPTGSEIFQFPGIAFDSAGTKIALTGVTFGATYTTLTVASSTVAVGDLIQFYISGSANYLKTFYASIGKVRTGSTSTSIRIQPLPALTGTIAGHIIESESPARAAFSVPSATVTQYDYFLPGVSSGITDIDDIALEESFRTFNPETGADVSKLTANTSPSISEYGSILEAGGYLTIESPLREYLGNIVCREIKRVKAK